MRLGRASASLPVAAEGRKTRRRRRIGWSSRCWKGIAVQDGLAPHCRRVMRAVLEGRVVTLLGAGANLCGRPPGEAWERGRYLPSGAELAGCGGTPANVPADRDDELRRRARARVP